MHNICLTIANISRTGGEERMCVLLANELINQGNNVIIVSQNNYYWQKIFFKLDRRVKAFSMKRCLFEYAVCKFIKRSDYDIRKYRRILKTNDVELIIDVDTEMSLTSIPASEGLGIKIISWEHFCYQRFSQRSISSSILKCIKDKVDALVVLTKADKALFINNGGVPAEKVHQIYNPSPIEMTEFTLHEGNKVLSMGRLEEEKGIDLLLKSWKIIEDQNIDWQLEIVGAGSQKKYLMELCASLGLKSVIFTHFTAAPIEKYRESSIFVLPSRQEGLSLSLLEAANMCLPIVAFDCPNGPREIIVNDFNGYLVESGNVNAFADTLLDLINNKEKRDRIEANSLDSVVGFKLSEIMAKWTLLISSLLS